MAAIVKKGILGKKIGMTRIFQEDGEAVPCTLVEAGPCTVVQHKTLANDGYEAMQIAYQTKRDKLVTQPMAGHFKKAGAEPFRHVREVRLLDGAKDAPAVGEKIDCSIFAAGDRVDVIGTSKGRGFTGVIKRHNFKTLKESHGGHFFVRHAGSIGSRKPQHTLPGTRMGGQHGNARVTVQNLTVLRVDVEKNLLYIKGAVPGHPNALVLIRTAKKVKKVHSA